MPAEQLILLIATQVLLWLSLGWALYWTHQCYHDFPTKRWRLLAIMAWLSFGLLASFVCTVAIIVGCPTLPVMRIVVWVDRTATIIGYTAVGFTSYQVIKFYRGQGYGN